MLRNDKERREYIENEKNWTQVGDTTFGLLRLMMLTYGDAEWYKVQVFQEHQHYDCKAGRFEWVREWVTLGIFTISNVRRAFSYGWSTSRIVEAIKEADKEARHKGGEK